MKDIRVREKFMQHVFIVGAKGFTYGGYEIKPVTFTITAVPADTHGAEDK